MTHRDSRGLTPAENALLDEFRTELQAIREEETERLRLALYELEFLHAGMAELPADIRAGRLQPPDHGAMH
jgi:hypothetical protein